eukprot:g1280.t1
MASNLMDLMNADFSDEESDDETSVRLFEKYGKVFPLHAAAEAGDADAIVPILSKSGNLDFNPDDDEIADEVSIDQRDHDECTALHVSLLNRHINCVNVCLEKGASLEGSAAMLLGAHPLHLAVFAAARGDAAERGFALAATKAILAKMMQRAKAKEKSVHVFLLADAIGRTPLHITAMFGAKSCADALIGSASSRDSARNLLLATDRRGRTALHTAAEHAHRSSDRSSMLAFMRTLLLASAAASAETTKRNELGDARDERGVTALDIVRAIAWKEGVALLSKFAFSETTASSGALPAGMLRRRHAASADGDATGKTLIVTHPKCSQHFTCPPSHVLRKTKEIPPSENVRRLTVLCDEKYGSLRASEFRNLAWSTASRAALADIVRVHEYAYVSALEKLCADMKEADTPSTATRTLDRDCTVSLESYNAALVAAGGSIDAVRSVVAGKYRNAFCAVRPPGHHAGPRGKVASIHDQCGSHGFCLFNNVAVAAAHARAALRDDVQRVAIIDFDGTCALARANTHTFHQSRAPPIVSYAPMRITHTHEIVHHGNGTEECLRNLLPSVRCVPCRGPQVSTGLQMSGKTNAVELGLRSLTGFATSFKPWKDDNDVSNIFFASTHGYGKLSDGSYMYPGSGATCGCTLKDTSGGDTRDLRELFGLAPDEDPAVALSPEPWNNTEALKQAVKGARQSRATGCTSGSLNGRFDDKWNGRILNCAMDRRVRLQWRLLWIERILPALHRFNPDLILISAGFDAHFQDEINHGFVGLVADDYAWLTRRIVQLANARCEGRVVSVLEGGYRSQGDATSPLARSVAAHVRSLEDTPSDVKWSPTSEMTRWESKHLRKMIAGAKGWGAPSAKSNGGEAAPSGDTTGNAESLEPRAKRRRRSKVDYAKLNAEMERNKAQ